ncbi:MAG: pyruvate dehydrogenase E2 component (dihydrolipoamide acetyltransferase) [Pseudohongiellaceae bacterium]
MAIEKITVPDLGDASEVEVIELLVSVGQKVEKEDSLLVLESDKAAMEIPAPMAGVVISIAVNLGDKVSSGSEMLSLEISGDSEGKSEDKADKKSSESDDKSEESSDTKPKESSKQAAAVEPEANEEKPSKEKSASQGKASSVTEKVPDLGTDDEVEVIEVHFAVGDSVSVDDSLITLESDKAAMEVPATLAGKVEELLVKVGDKLKTGDSILKLLSSSESPAADAPATTESKPSQDEAKKAEAKEPAPKPAQKSAPETIKTPPSDAGQSGGSKTHAGPAVRKLARELGVDLTAVAGTGAKDRIIKEDVNEYVKARLNAPSSGGGAIASVPDIDFSQFGEIEQVKRSKLEKLTAVNMHRNWSAVPHVAQFNEADVTDLENFREGLKAEAEKKGVKMTFMPFLLKACAKALAEYPQFNVSLHSSGEYVIQKKYINIGIAVATDAGLLVPVIRDVDKKSLWELAAEVVELSDKAKKRKLTPQEMQGGCFSISSLGALGGTGFIPIVSSPEVAILGVSKTDIKPVYIDGEFKPRKMLPFTLSYDHKAVNGLDGGLFATYLAKVLGDIRHLVL